MKNIKELKDEDLEKVAGGFTVNPSAGKADTRSFNCGDTFKLNDSVHDIYIYIFFFFLGQNGSIYSMNDEIPLTVYNTDVPQKIYTQIKVMDLVIGYTYLGIHTEAELNALCGTN